MSLFCGCLRSQPQVDNSKTSNSRTGSNAGHKRSIRKDRSEIDLLNLQKQRETELSGGANDAGEDWSSLEKRQLAKKNGKASVSSNSDLAGGHITSSHDFVSICQNFKLYIQSPLFQHPTHTSFNFLLERITATTNSITIKLYTLIFDRWIEQEEEDKFVLSILLYKFSFFLFIVLFRFDCDVNHSFVLQEYYQSADRAIDEFMRSPRSLSARRSVAQQSQNTQSAGGQASNKSLKQSGRLSSQGLPGSQVYKKTGV